MSDDSHDYDLIDRLAEEFASRFRNGERPSIQEYCDKYPSIADDLRAMLPALAEVEQVKDEVHAPPAVEVPKLRQIGEYHILREVGRGGMGVVYEAEQVTLGRRVALKVLAGGKSGHGLERFKREARAAARLHHTNIVPVFNVGDFEGLPFYVMQFIQGLGVDEVMEEVRRLQALSGAAVPPSSVNARSVRKDISAAAVARSLVTGRFQPPSDAFEETRTHAPANVGQVSNLSGQNGQVGNPSYDKPASTSSSISLPGQSTISGRKPTYWQSVAQIGLQVADALDYAHKQGVLHRDIKPSNLLLDLHGVVWVTDFGLAKADDQENLTHTGDVLGTLRYMPPEAFEGTSDARSDVYSLGLSMYELLALRPAYDERKRELLIKQVTTTDPPRLGSLNKSIPRDLQTIVHKAIEKNPDHRYKSAADLAADLRRYLSDQPILARRIHPIERFTRWCKRNPTVAGLSTAVFVLLIAVATVSAAMAIRVEGKAEEARFEANRANEETDRAKAARKEADLNLELAHVLLSEQFVHRGAQLMTEGDVAGAALCYARALKADQSDPDRTLTHRIRLAAALRDAPRPRHILFHTHRVLCTATSPDGKLFATGCDDSKVYIWDLASGERVGPPLPHEREISAIAFVDGGKRVWTQSKGADFAEPEFDPNTGSLTGTNVTNYEVRLWDRETAKILESGKRHFPTWFYVPNSATPQRGTVGFFSKPTTVEPRDRDTGKPIGPQIEVTEPITIAYASLQFNRIVVSNLAPVPKNSPPTTRRDRRYETRVFELTTGNSLRQLPQSSQEPSELFGTNDRFIILTDPVSGAAQWYDIVTGDKGPTVAQPGAVVNSIQITPDHRRVVISFAPRGFSPFTVRSADTKFHLVDADTGKEVVSPFALSSTSSPRTFSSRNLVPNLDASRFVVQGTGAFQLLHSDGTTTANQPDSSTSVWNFSPDGSHLLTVGIDNMVRVWNSRAGQPITSRMPHDGPVQSAQFTTDGSHVIIVSGSAVWIWPIVRADQGHGVALSNETRTKGPAPDRFLSADGSRVLEHVSFGQTRVLDAATGQVVAGPIETPRVREDQSAFRGSIHFRQDGRAVVFVVRDDSRFEGAFPGNGKRAFDGARVTLWNCDTGKLTDLANLSSLLTVSAEFSPDGRFVRTILPDGEHNLRLRLWDATTAEPQGPGASVELQTAKGVPIKAGSIPSARFYQTWTPDSSLAVYREPVAGNLRFRIFDARTGTEVAPPIVLDSARVADIAFDAKGERMLTLQRGSLAKNATPLSKSEMSGRVQLWDLRTGKPIGSPVFGLQLGGYILTGSVNPAGDRLAIGVGLGIGRGRSDSTGGGPGIYLWDPVAGHLATPLLHHDQSVIQSRFSPDGQWLVTATTRHIRLWSVTTGELLQAIPTGEDIADVNFSHDGRRIVASMQNASGPFVGPGAPRTLLQIWDARTGQPLTPPLRSVSISRRSRAGILENATTEWSRNADRMLVMRDDNTPEVYSLAGDERPIDELLVLAEVLSVRQVNSAGVIQGVAPNEFRKSFASARARFASDWPASVIEGNEWYKRLLPGAQYGFIPAGMPARVNSELAGQCLWFADRLLIDHPDNPGYHALRARCLSSRGEFVAAEAAATKAIELTTVNKREFYLLRADIRLELEKWDAAEADLKEHLKQPTEPDNEGTNFFPFPVAHGTLALLRLRRGDIKGYRDACAELSLPTSGSGGGSPMIARNLWVAFLIEDAIPEAKLKEIFKSATDLGFGRGFGAFAVNPSPFSMETMLRFRQKRYEEAEAFFASDFAPTRADYYILAMIQFKLGKPEARATLEKSKTMKDEPAPMPSGTGLPAGFVPIQSIILAPDSWRRKLVDETLKKEAETLILGKKS